ncbi:MAG: outer membrane protein assembly factor BamA [candidate division Zixibacteria bacterium]|nr:outer membrane protein assembly factor BamA [candidate division Zixibacteria bacterium]
MRTLLLFKIITIYILSLFIVDFAFANDDKFTVRSVRIEGNEAFEDDRVRGLMVSRPPGFLSSTKFYPEVFESDLQNIIYFYNQHGYLQASIIDTSIYRDSVEMDVDLYIDLKEGEVTHVEGISIFGNTVFSDSTLLETIGLSDGDPYSNAKVSEGMLKIVSMYADSGYLEASIKPDTRINDVTRTAIVDLQVEENQQSVIESITFEGSKLTKTHVIRKELLFEEGEVVNYSDLMKSQRDLYLTGLFKSVFIRPRPTPDSAAGKKDILIELNEVLPHELGLTVGYGSIDKLRGKVELLTNNWMGTARKLGLTASASFVKRRVEGSFTEPYSLGTKFKTDVNLFFEFLEEPGYDLRKYGGELTVGRRFAKNANISLTFRYENSRLLHVETTDIPEDFDSRVRSLKLSVTNDSRDNLFNPTKGTYQEFSHEIAGAFLQGTSAFTRTIVRVKGFLPWGRNAVLASAVEFGWSDYFGDASSLPLNERFYAGGPNSLRGFEYQKAGPLDENNVPVGGQFKIVWNVLEIRRAIYKMVGIGLFFDAGNVWRNITYFQSGTIRYTAGAGIRADTPVGILRLDYGRNLDPRDFENPNQFYFSIGHAF